MTPNLRFNKDLTKKLRKAIPKDDYRPTLSTIEWNMENGNNIYGLTYTGLFKGTMFFLQRTEPNKYRLVVSDGSPLCSFYLIDNIEKFLQLIGVEVLELENGSDVKKALEETIIVPNTGIITVEDDGVFVYEHENY